MKNTRLNKVMMVLLVLFLVGGAGVFFATHERVVTTTIRPKTDALKHPFTALEFLLSNEIRKVTYDQGNLQLDDVWADTATASTKSVILLDVDGLQPSSFDGILAWVQAGGHLVLFSDGAFFDNNLGATKDTPIDKLGDAWQAYVKQENPLLIHLGIYNRQLDWNAMRQEQSGRFTTFDVPIQLDGQVLVLEGGAGRFVVYDFLAKYKQARPYQYYAKSLNDPYDVSVLDKHHTLSHEDKLQLNLFMRNAPTLTDPHRVVFDSVLGKGRITVFQDKALLKNPNPIQVQNTQAQPQDHKPRWWYLLSNTHQMPTVVYQDGVMYKDTAYFLDYLTKGRATVQIVPHIKNKGIVALMRQHTPFLMWSLVVGLVAILLRLPRQAGRREVLAKGDGSDVLAYLSGVGAYLWDSDLCAKQVSANRANLLDKIHAKLPTLHNASNDQKCTLIAQDIHLPPETVYLALYETWGDEDEFVLMTQAFWQVAQAYEF